MRPFRFPLEAVLVLRRSTEEKALEKYADSVKATLLARQNEEAARQNMAVLQECIAEGRSEAFSPHEQQAYWASLEAAEESLLKTIQNVREVERKQTTALQEFLKAKQATDLLERLKTKRKEAHEAEVRHREEVQTEDLIISRAFRSRASV